VDPGITGSVVVSVELELSELAALDHLSRYIGQPLDFCAWYALHLGLRQIELLTPPSISAQCPSR
jgi:hypothetical protein